MMASVLSIPSLASVAAIPPAPANLLALAPKKLGEALAEQVAASGYAGGLNYDSPLDHEDVTAHGRALHRAALACIDRLPGGGGGGPPRSPLVIVPSPYRGFTPASTDRPGAAPPSPTGGLERHFFAELSDDSDGETESSDARGGGGAKKKAAMPTAIMTIKEVREKLDQGAMARQSVANITAAGKISLSRSVRCGNAASGPQ